VSHCSTTHHLTLCKWRKLNCTCLFTNDISYDYEDAISHLVLTTIKGSDSDKAGVGEQLWPNASPYTTNDSYWSQTSISQIYQWLTAAIGLHKCSAILRLVMSKNENAHGLRRFWTLPTDRHDKGWYHVRLKNTIMPSLLLLLVGLGRLCKNPIVDSIGQNNRPMR